MRKQGVKWQAWVQIRNEDGPLNGQFEFPGGKIEAGETSFEAAARELLEEVGIETTPASLQLFQICPYEYSDRQVCLYFHLLEVLEENKKWDECGRWCDLENICDNLLEANIPVVEKLKDYLEREPSLGAWA